MTMTVAESLAATEVVFCLDTNILVEFRSPAELPWKELAPNATTIRLIVPTKVGTEMDQHKFSSGRLRKRAAEFAELARRIEDSEDRPVRLSTPDADIALTIEFGPLYRTKDLDGEKFDLDDPDNRVVAEATMIARDIPELILLADDSLPIRLARHVGLLHVRPPRSWRRPADGDERDETIADLRRQLGPQPNLVLNFPPQPTITAGMTSCRRPMASARTASTASTARRWHLIRKCPDQPLRRDIPVRVP